METNEKYIVAIVFKRVDEPRIYVNQYISTDKQPENGDEALGIAVREHSDGYPAGDFCILETEVFFIGKAKKESEVDDE